ncbi:MAG: arsenosugar biosynthesis radical SAM (seleno)protein ArsS [Planctomycetota bacterium]
MTETATELDRFPELRRGRATTLQFNLGRLCNQACRHCHVDSSPARKGPEDNAQQETVDAAIRLLESDPGLTTVDLTGGAPELNPHFRRLVAKAQELGRTVFVRHNLTVQFEESQSDLPAFFRDHGVVLYCSLPCYLEDNVDKQRGRGVFDKSIEAIQRLNEVGYGKDLELNLVYNPQGPSLPPPQQGLEEDYRQVLGETFGIQFSHLLTITNQPIHRFRDDLERQGALDDYHQLLVEAFNPGTLDGLMCRSTLSLRWDGRLYDCDFNLVQDLPLRDLEGNPLTIEQLVRDGSRSTESLRIAVDKHCFACTAGAGSSCGGSLA